jgi:hypothetical protein
MQEKQNPAAGGPEPGLFDETQEKDNAARHKSQGFFDDDAITPLIWRAAS